MKVACRTDVIFFARSPHACPARLKNAIFFAVLRVRMKVLKYCSVKLSCIYFVRHKLYLFRNKRSAFCSVIVLPTYLPLICA